MSACPGRDRYSITLLTKAIPGWQATAGSPQLHQSMLLQTEGKNRISDLSCGTCHSTLLLIVDVHMSERTEASVQWETSNEPFSGLCFSLKVCFCSNELRRVSKLLTLVVSRECDGGVLTLDTISVYSAVNAVMCIIHTHVTLEVWL